MASHDKTQVRCLLARAAQQSRRLRVLCFATLISLAATPAARGDTTWNNLALNQTWDFVLNWTDGVPDEFDNVTFPDPIPFINIFPNAGTISLPALAAVRTLALQTGGYTLTGGTLLVDQGTINAASGNSTFLTTIAGVSGLTKSGPGGIALGGSNAYSGATTVNQGTLDVVLSPERIPNASSVSIASGASLRFFDGTSTETIGSLAGAGTVVFGNTNGGGTNLIAGGNNSFTTFSGNIIQQFGGTGRLTKAGSGQLTLTGANSYTGGTTISGGVLEVNTNSLPASGAVTNNSSLVFNQGFNAAFAPAISGSGVVIKQGGGTLTLSGANSYAQGTVITAGTLAVSSDSNLGAGSAPVHFDGGTLQIGGATNFDFHNARSFQIQSGSSARVNVLAGSAVNLLGGISGGGDLIKSGGGSLTLQSGLLVHNPSTYTGATRIEDGALAVARTSATAPAELIPDQSEVIISNSGVLDLVGLFSIGTLGYTETIGSLSGSINTAVRFIGTGGNHLRAGANNSSTVFDGRIADDTGSGKFTKLGTGKLTLTGANAYSEGTVVEGGTLQVNSDSLPAAGGAVNNAVLVFDQAANGTYAGVISGAGRVEKIGVGALTLNQANTYAGGTRINAGTLVVSHDDNLGADDSTVLFAGGRLRIVNGSPFSFPSSRQFLTAGDAIFDANGSALFELHGGISGIAGLTLNGPGLMSLGTTASTYNGPTSINAGALLRIQSGEMLPNATDVTLNLSTLSLSGGVTETIDALNGSGTVSFENGTNNHLRLGGNNGDGNYSGTIVAAAGGDGRLTKLGSGAQRLSGTAAYAGGTTVSGGRLIVTANSLPAAGGVTNDATLEFNQTVDGAYPGLIAGFGAVVKSGDGKLTLSQSNNYAGGTRIEQGVLEIGADANLGIGSGAVTFAGGALRVNGGNVVSARPYVAANDDGVFDIQATVFEVQGGISGSNRLFKTGPGTMVLSTTAATYGGQTIIGQGSLQTLQDELLPNTTDLTISGGSVLLMAGVTETIDALHGSGSVRFQTGPGNHLILGADNGNGTFTGEIAPTSGEGAVTKIGNGAQLFTNNIVVRDLDVNQGQVAFDGGVGTISGTLAVAGAGQLDLVDGALVVATLNLSAAGSAFNMTGGRLQPEQVLGALDVSGGTLATRLSPGTTTISGDFIQRSQATLEIALGGANPGEFDRLTIAGSAQLGGTLDVKLVDDFTPSANDMFPFASALGGVNGAFVTEMLPDLGPGLMFDVVYGANAVTLKVVPRFAADFDEDGDVDADDLARWRAGFGLSGSATHLQGDADGDLDVDGADVLAWQRQLNGATVVAASAAVPEPATMALLLLAAVGGCLRRRPTIATALHATRRNHLRR